MLLKYKLKFVMDLNFILLSQHLSFNANGVKVKIINLN